MKTYLTTGETLYTYTHASGLRVYVLPKKGYGKSYALFAADFGSVHNRFFLDGEEVTVPDGMAHFLEHKLFEEEEGNVFADFSALGASANAFTSFDMTGYLFSATSHFYDALRILIRFVQHPYFTVENVEKEKGIIGQEIDMYRDDPDWNSFFGMLRAMYQKHPIRIDIAGSAASIAKIDKDILYRCYQAFYAPANMILFTVGDIEPEKVQEVVEQTAEDRPSPKVDCIWSKEPEEVGEAETCSEFMVARPMFTLGFKEPVMEDPVLADAAYTVLGSLLFGKSTPLYKSLYEAHLVSDAYAYSYTAGKGYAFLQIDSESDDPKAAGDQILEAVRAAKRNGIREDDFVRIKRCVFGDAIRALGNVENIAQNFVATAFRGGDYLAYADAVRNLRISDVEAILQNGLRTERSVLSVIKPKERGTNR